MNKLMWLILFLLFLLLVLILTLRCSQEFAIKGRYYPELASPESRGTLLFFFVENVDLYQSRETSFGQIEKLERMINRLKVDLNQLALRHPNLKFMYIDINQRRSALRNYGIYNIPTIILFDKRGYEVRRWTPADYSRGGGTMRELENLIINLSI